VSEPSGAAPHPQQRSPSLLARLVRLPFHLFGVLCGSLLLSITLECVGVACFWPDEGERHARDMFAHELTQFSEDFTQSVLAPAPGRAAREWGDRAYEGVFVRSGLAGWLQEASAPSRGSGGREFRHSLGQAGLHARAYLMAAAYTVLVFLVRLLVLALTLPLFLMAGLTGLIDGLARRDVRRFGAGRESGFVYHRARASLTPLATLPWVVYLALPVSAPPLLILLPGAAALGVAMCITAATFKKYV
jgi:integrating conjugative element membrane protein (TIGR03747 family)